MIAGREYRKWRQFLEWVAPHSDSRWVFRGLGDKSFELKTGLGRLGIADAKVLEVRERSILENFYARAHTYLDVSNHSVWDLLALGQHHGLPTRLLDWSRNPLAAAYFAVTSDPGRYAKTGSLPKQELVDAKIVAFRVKSGSTISNDFGAKLPKNFDAAIKQVEAEGRVRFLIPRSVSHRIVSQGGLFSVHPQPLNAWHDPVNAQENVFVIPGYARRHFCQRLFYLGIEPQHIMGGIDGLCARLKWQAEKGVGMGVVR